jgi:hypothetical protein
MLIEYRELEMRYVFERFLEVPLKKTVLLIGALFAISACNGGGGGNNGSPNNPNTNTTYAATPNGCANNLPTSACVPVNNGYNNSGYNNGYNNGQYGNNFYGQGGYIGFNQGSNFVRYGQPLPCSPGFVPVVPSRSQMTGFVGQYNCVSLFYIQNTMGIQQSQLVGYQQQIGQGYNQGQGIDQQEEYDGNQDQQQQYRGNQRQSYYRSTRNGGQADVGATCTMSPDSCLSMNSGNATCSPYIGLNGSPLDTGLCKAR